MKMTKPIYLLTFTLALTLAATGCKHKPVGITRLPGSPAGNPSDYGDLNTKPYNPTDTGAGSSPGNLATTPLTDFDNMTPDPAALAAYTIHFAFDSSVIRSSEQANIDGVASALNSDPSTKLIIQGNCDERGTEEYNRSLGERRALAAREALAKKGVDPSRIRTISFGKDKPADPGHDESAWSKNRRDDFVLLHPKTGA